MSLTKTLLAATAVVAMAVGAQAQEQQYPTWCDPERLGFNERTPPEAIRAWNKATASLRDVKEFCDAERKKLIEQREKDKELIKQSEQRWNEQISQYKIPSGLPPACYPPQRPSFNDRTPPEAIKAWDESHKDWLTPQLKAFCDKERATLEAAVEAQKAAAAAAAEAQRKAAEAKLAAQAEAEKRAAEYQRWAATPEGQRQIAADTLLQAYVLFARVQFCRQLRDGYAVVYISEPEYERSRAAVKAVEKSILAQQPSLNTNAIWQQAVQEKGFYANDTSCANTRIALYKMSPTSVYQYQKP
jgi:hypothetical protein